MLIRESTSGYKHLDVGNIKLAFTRVCQEEIFRDVYFAANSLYYVESGSVTLRSKRDVLKIKKGEIALTKYIRILAKLAIFFGHALFF